MEGRPSLADIASACNLATVDELCAAWVWGSRLYGCASPASDWDVVAVLVPSAAPLGDVVVVERGELNVALYDWPTWLGVLAAHFVWARMLVDLPAEHPCCVRAGPSAMRTPLRVPLLRKAALTDAQHNWKKAARLWAEGDHRKSAKNVVHAIRYLLLALQLVRHGCVIDFAQGNDVWRAVVVEGAAQPHLAWEQWTPPFRERYQALMTQMEQHHVREARVDVTLPHQHQCLAYVRQFGDAAFERDFCAVVHVLRDHPGLVALGVQKRHAPCGFAVARDTRLLVARADWSAVVAQSDAHALECSSKYVADFPWKRRDLSVTTKVRTRTDYLLFHHDGQWRVASLGLTQDAAEEAKHFWSAFGRWPLPSDELRGRSFSFALAEDGALYFYGGVDSGSLRAFGVEGAACSEWRCVATLAVPSTVDGSARMWLQERANSLEPVHNVICGFVVRSAGHYQYPVTVCSDAQEALEHIRPRVHLHQGDNEALMLRVLARCGSSPSTRRALDAHFATTPYAPQWALVCAAFDSLKATLCDAYDAEYAPLAHQDALASKHRWARMWKVMRFGIKDEGKNTQERFVLFALRANAAQLHWLQDALELGQKAPAAHTTVTGGEWTQVGQ